MSDELPLAVGRRVRTLRQELTISQEELAGRAGLHRNYIGSVERGERDIGMEALARIAGALGLSLADFFAPFRQKSRVPEASSRRSVGVSGRRRSSSS